MSTLQQYPISKQQYKYYSVLGMAFVTLLLTANILGPKPLALGFIVVPAGLLIFPLTYLIGGVLTEVYGYGASRTIIWMGLIANIFLALSCKVAIMLPYDSSWGGQYAYESVLGFSSRLMFISVVSYFLGEMINSVIVAKLKVKMHGKAFWLRAICGNWIGEAIESSVFVPLAFYHLPANVIIKMLFFYYSFKLVYCLFTIPILNKMARFLKEQESTDYYDVDTNFNPFG